MIAANPKLRHIAAQSISPSNIDVAEATARRIPVTVVPPVTTEATADLNFGLMLAVARRMVEGDRLVRAGKFPGGQSRHLLGSIVWGKTIGLIGGGGLIGKAVARRAHGFGMRVLYWTPRRKPESEEREAGLTFVPLDRASARIRFRLAAFAAQRADPPPDRRARARPDEEDAPSSSIPRAARSSTKRRWCARLGQRRSPAPGSTCSSTSPRFIPN